MYVCACLVVSASLWSHGLYSPLGFYVHGIFQARILEWVAISYSGYFPYPGIETDPLHFLHWQVDSLALYHLGNQYKLYMLNPKSSITLDKLKVLPIIDMVANSNSQNLFCFICRAILVFFFVFFFFYSRGFYFILFKHLFILFYLTLQYCIGFAIYQNESATGMHVFPILNPPPSYLPIPSLWVIPVHQPQASSIVHRTYSFKL